MKLFLLSCQFIVISMVSFSQEDTLVLEETRIEPTYVVPESIDVDVSILTPPEGFVSSDAFAGYIHYQTGSAISLTMIDNVNYLKLVEGMNEEFYKANKLVYISDSKITADDGTSGMLYKFSFKIDTNQYVRYMAYLGDLNKTLWLSITYPLMVEELVEQDLIKSVLSTKFKTKREDEE